MRPGTQTSPQGSNLELISKVYPYLLLFLTHTEVCQLSITCQWARREEQDYWLQLYQQDFPDLYRSKSEHPPELKQVGTDRQDDNYKRKYQLAQAEYRNPSGEIITFAQFRSLISNRDDAKAVSSSKDILLYVAASFGHMEMTQILIANGANVNATYGYGNRYTLLHTAAESGSVDVAMMLILNNANVNAFNHNYFHTTPLHIAVRHDQGAMVKLLLTNRADPYNANSDRENVFDFAERYGRSHITPLLNEAVGYSRTRTGAANRWGGA